MNRQTGFTLYEALIVSAIILILASLLVLPYFQCKAQTGKMGFASEWGLISGCMVEHKPEKWIPLDRYRALED